MLTNKSEGILTFYHPRFGRREVCADKWGNNVDSEVACRHVGYTGAKTTSFREHNNATLLIICNSLCRGSEELIWDCHAKGWTTVSTCRFGQVLFLSCY